LANCTSFLYRGMYGRCRSGNCIKPSAFSATERRLRQPFAVPLGPQRKTTGIRTPAHDANGEQGVDHANKY
jgi:hypothetical protein